MEKIGRILSDLGLSFYQFCRTLIGSDSGGVTDGGVEGRRANAPLAAQMWKWGPPYFGFLCFMNNFKLETFIQIYFLLLQQCLAKL